MAERLSKSRFQLALQCTKALWLQSHSPKIADPVSESQQRIFDTGNRVGELARELFPDGVLVTEDHRASARALATTEEVMKNAPRAIFEGAFFHGGVFVRPDLLVREEDGSWILGEVKSSTKAKSEHESDVAIQTWVLEGCGLSISRIELIHIDNSYVWDGGPYDLMRLFKAADLTEAARAWQLRIPTLVEEYLKVLAGPLPDVQIGAQCHSPYTCAFYDHCHRFLPDRHPVTDLPRINSELLSDLLGQGIHSITQIPVDHPGLSAGQRAVVDLATNGQPHYEGDPAASLSELVFPLHFLDFETMNPALPLYPGTRPYQQIPFQWSDHVLYEDGRLEHREFLWQYDGDPRQAFIDTLITALGEFGSIIHYSPFEGLRLRELAVAIPARAHEIQSILQRLFDMERTIRTHVRHPDCLGLSSIKVVLPALVKDLSYQGLAIADGQTATLRYLSTMDAGVHPGVRKKTFQDLLAYCALDTLAMVELYKVLIAAGKQG